eukprot:SAG22_NODE_1374_length_4563_cov_1.852823_2_plen_258_part_00
MPGKLRLLHLAPGGQPRWCSRSSKVDSAWLVSIERREMAAVTSTSPGPIDDLRSGTARKGSETERKAVITAFKERTSAFSLAAAAVLSALALPTAAAAPPRPAGVVSSERAEMAFGLAPEAAGLPTPASSCFRRRRRGARCVCLRRCGLLRICLGVHTLGCVDLPQGGGQGGSFVGISLPGGGVRLLLGLLLGNGIQQLLDRRRVLRVVEGFERNLALPGRGAQTHTHTHTHTMRSQRGTERHGARSSWTPMPPSDG